MIDDERPRRRRVAAARIAIERDPNLLMRVFLHSPKDMIAGVVAVAAVATIVINAVFLQESRHPSPMFSGSPEAIVQAQPQPRESSPAASVAPMTAVTPAPASSEFKPADKPVANPAAPPPRPPLPVPGAKRTDPVGDLIKSSRRIASVQRVLSDYGYGQLKPTGIIGPDTQAAIQKFERERKMPVTGELSERLIHDLGVLAGRPID